MEQKICVIALVVKDRSVAPKVNDILTKYGSKIVARLGVPYKEKDVSVISVVLEATNDDIGALTGKLGQIKEVQVKSITI